MNNDKITGEPLSITNYNKYKNNFSKHKLTHLFEEFSCSVFTGIMKVIVIQPFDLIRFRIQSGDEIKNKLPIKDIIKSFINGEGVRVLFKGFNVTSFSVFSSSIVQFTLYQQAYDILYKQFIPRVNYDGEKPLDILTILKDSNRVNNNFNPVNETKLIHLFSLTCAISGFLSGVGLGLLLTPVDNIRIKLQAAQNVENAKTRAYRFNNSLELIKSIYSNTGVKGFYVALPLALFRESIASVIYFGSFEYMKNKEKVKYNRTRIKIHNSFLYGAFAGGINWLITLPIDTVKTKLIADTVIFGNKQFENYSDCIKKVYSQGGFQGFYKGFSVVFLRGLIVNGVVLTSFDICRSNFVEHSKDAK